MRRGDRMHAGRYELGTVVVLALLLFALAIIVKTPLPGSSAGAISWGILVTLLSVGAVLCVVEIADHFMFGNEERDR